MELRPQQSTSLNWQRDRLFIQCRFLRGCSMGAKHCSEDVRGMLSIRVSCLMSALNALHALLGQ